MFSVASSFNSAIPFNTSKVTAMSYMFEDGDSVQSASALKFIRSKDEFHHVDGQRLRLNGVLSKH